MARTVEPSQDERRLTESQDREFGERTSTESESPATRNELSRTQRHLLAGFRYTQLRRILSLVAAAVTVLGVLWILAAAIVAANPYPQIVLTLVAIGILGLMVMKPPRPSG